MILFKHISCIYKSLFCHHAIAIGGKIVFITTSGKSFFCNLTKSLCMSSSKRALFTDNSITTSPESYPSSFTPSGNHKVSTLTSLRSNCCLSLWTTSPLYASSILILSESIKIFTQKHVSKLFFFLLVFGRILNVQLWA